MSELHPFRGYASAFQVLCDVAEQKGWKVWLQLADASGMTYPHKQPGLAATAYRQVVLEGHGFVIREREEHPGSCRLDELANRLLERVIV